MSLPKDHIYRMVIVEGHCTMARSSSWSKLFIGWHKSIVCSDWSDTMVWLNIAVPFFYHPIDMILVSTSPYQHYFGLSWRISILYQLDPGYHQCYCYHQTSTLLPRGSWWRSRDPCRTWESCWYPQTRWTHTTQKPDLTCHWWRSWTILQEYHTLVSCSLFWWTRKS